MAEHHGKRSEVTTNSVVLLLHAGKICHMVVAMTKEPDSEALLDKIAEKRDQIARLDREKEIAVIELRAYEDAAKIVFGGDYQTMYLRSLLTRVPTTGGLMDPIPSETGKSIQEMGLFGLRVKSMAAKNDLFAPIKREALTVLGKMFVDQVSGVVTIGDQPGKRKRRLSVMWAQILAALNSQPSFDYKDLLEVAEKLGHEVTPNVARSQMKLYADSGLVERIDDGKFRVTVEGVDASARTLLRVDEASDEAEAPESPDD